MSRQHATPILLGPGGPQTVIALPMGAGPDQISEADLQDLIHRFPSCLPIREIDPLFADPVPLCTELNTSAGPIDNLMVTASGLPVIVECKLWRNPEGRREVVGQIIDYAKELARWSASDLQREVARRTQIADNPIVALLRAAGRTIDEVEFNDALTLNLRKGRFLLLIVGDGIREGVESIAEYLQSHANLHFSLGLVELPIFVLDDGRRIVTPRLLARTHIIERTVVAVPEGYTVQQAGEVIDEDADDEHDPTSRISFWRAFIAGLVLDDPGQAPPKPSRQGYCLLPLPVPGGTAWLTVYRNEARNKVGVYLSYTRDSFGARLVDRLLEGWPDIKHELGNGAVLETDKLGRRIISEDFVTRSWALESEREKAFAWLRERTNAFVNVLRPKIKLLAEDMERDS